MSFSAQVSFMPSLKRSSSMTNTSCDCLSPNVKAADSNSLRLVSPRPSASPVERHRIFT